MRVCHLGKYYPPAYGGIETFVRALATAQSKMGMEVKVVCFQHEKSPTTNFLDGDVSVTRLGRTARFLDLDWCPDLLTALKSIEPDLIHVHVPNPVMILALLALRLPGRIPIVVSYHADHVRQVVRGFFFRTVESLFYPRVNRIIANSDGYRAGSLLLQKYASQVRVVPYGIELAPFRQPRGEEIRASVAIKQGHPGPLWLFSGRLVGYKGIIHAVRAMNTAPGTLLIAGDGPERTRIESEILRLGLTNKVKLVGSPASLIPYYRAASALWLTSISRAESFGIVQIEAMASGCPVINTAIPGSGVSSVSLDGETGLTVPPGDPAALAAAAHRIAESPTLRERFSLAAQTRAQRYFDMEKILPQWLQIYADVIGGQIPVTSQPAGEKKGVNALSW